MWYRHRTWKVPKRSEEVESGSKTKGHKVQNTSSAKLAYKMKIIDDCERKMKSSNSHLSFLVSLFVLKKYYKVQRIRCRKWLPVYKHTVEASVESSALFSLQTDAFELLQSWLEPFSQHSVVKSLHRASVKKLNAVPGLQTQGIDSEKTLAFVNELGEKQNKTNKIPMCLAKLLCTDTPELELCECLVTLNAKRTNNSCQTYRPSLTFY